MDGGLCVSVMKQLLGAQACVVVGEVGGGVRVERGWGGLTCVFVVVVGALHSLSVPGTHT